MTVWLVLLSSILAVPASAARPTGAAVDSSCKSMNYQSQLGPVRDQGRQEWCFAYAAADLVTQKMKAPASAADLANTHQRGRVAREHAEILKERDGAMRNIVKGTPEQRALLAKFYEDVIRDAGGRVPIDRDRQGGNIAEAIAEANKLGFCKEKDVPSTRGAAGMMHAKIVAEDKLLKLKMLREPSSVQKTDCPPGKEGGGVSSNVAELNAISREAWTKAINEMCEMYLPGGGLRTSKTEQPYRWNEDGSLNLAEREKEKTLSAIDAALESGRIAGIAYNPDFLVQQKRGMKGGQPPSTHASTIVGRDCEYGCRSCRYLLRNSWGANCSTYAADKRKDCVDGHVWVSARELRDYVFTVTTLK